MKMILTMIMNVFLSQNSDLLRVSIFRAVRGMRRVQMSRDFCTRFVRYLFSTEKSWITQSNLPYNNKNAKRLLKLNVPKYLRDPIGTNIEVIL